MDRAVPFGADALTPLLNILFREAKQIPHLLVGTLVSGFFTLLNLFLLPVGH
jgi:hypothetical protein